MSYLILKHSSNPKEIGSDYPQIQSMSDNYDYEASNSVYAVSNEYLSLPKYEPNLNHFVLNKHAKLTDLVSVTVIHGGLLISEKLKKILQSVNLPLHAFYDASILFGNKYYQYYWMHIISDLTDHVNYSESTFFIYSNYSHNLGNIEISSKQELIQKKEWLKKNNPGKSVTIWAEKIKMNNSFDNLDLFEIGLFNSDIFITNNLYSIIAQNDITGVRIKPNTILSCTTS